MKGKLTLFQATVLLILLTIIIAYLVTIFANAYKTKYLCSKCPYIKKPNYLLGKCYCGKVNSNNTITWWEIGKNG